MCSWTPARWALLCVLLLALSALVRAEEQAKVEEVDDEELTPKRFIFAVSMYTVVMVAGRWIIANKPKPRRRHAPRNTSAHALAREAGAVPVDVPSN
mmetsp:Transcript_12208/g.49042  ORF Transcript_12208/g.49042 Transcript_12208/m.49042 type:complete len:97 (-) Transcript_12208:183-473(-)